MDTTKHDSAAKLREQRRLLDLIPPPGEAFEAAQRTPASKPALARKPSTSCIHQHPSRLRDLPNNDAYFREQVASLIL
jgi:hypothetical protein